MANSHLIDRFLGTDNFLSAFRRIEAKKSAGGIDNTSVEDFGKQLEKNIQRLQNQIRSGKYAPFPVLATHIPKFNEKNEWRELGLPAVSDKVVQAALLQAVEPVAEKVFCDTSYAYRPNKGHFKAMRRVEHNLRNKHATWVVRRDIDNFFDSVNHELLLSLFSHVIGDEPMLVELVALWCKMGLVEKSGKWRNIEAGLRQGNVISPLLANLYLTPLDEFAAQLKVDWVRYADDYLIQCATREDAERADAAIIAFLKNELSLSVNADSKPVGSIETGFSFLGIHFQGDKRSIAPVKLEKIRKKIQWLFSDRNKNSLEELLRHMTQSIQGWKSHYGFLKPIEQFRMIDAMLEEAFVPFATKRIAAGKWSKDLAQESIYPLLTPAGSVSGAEKMRALWSLAVKAAEPRPLEKVKKAVDAKISKSRRKHQKARASSNDMIVTTPGHFIGKRGERIIVRRNQKIIAETPSFAVSGLTLGTRGIALSSDVIELCLSKNIFIHLVDDLGKVVAVIKPPGGESGDTSLLQLNQRDTERGMTLARQFIAGKVKNQFALLKYYYKYPVNRNNGFGKCLDSHKNQMQSLLDEIRKTATGNNPDMFRQRLMGLEGAFANLYWDVVKQLFHNGLVFEGRTREGAVDPVNSSLNYGYGILYGRVYSAVVRAGLNPMAGFLHAFQPGKPVLIYDAIEEFRAMVVDRAVFTLLRRGEKIGVADNGLLAAESRKKVARAVIGRLSSEEYFEGKKKTLEDIIKEQAFNIKKHITKTATYKPFSARW